MRLALLVDVDEDKVEQKTVKEWEDYFETALTNYEEVCQAVALNYVSSGDCYQYISGEPRWHVQ